ncbi:MAG: glycosyltransferase family protein, partial [Planctomycetota bacterium]
FTLAMKTVCIIQTRMSSTRLPGKVMMNVCGKPIIHHVIDRVLRAKTVDKIVIATTTNPKDDRIVDAIQEYHPKVSVFRGSEEDVLDRYYQCAKAQDADVIVRVTSDCPLLDPDVIDSVTKIVLEDPSVDFATNYLSKRTFPRGLDTEAFPFRVLERLHKTATEAADREHVIYYIHRHPQDFVTKHIEHEQDESANRWTLDVAEDFELIKTVYERLYPANPTFGWIDVLALIKKEPQIPKLNAYISQKIQEGQIIIALQARMGSTRLPLKVLKEIQGVPMVERLYDRLHHVSKAHRVVLSTAATLDNQPLIQWAESRGVPYYAGSENDIVDRMYQTAKTYGAGFLVRITADCPLIDPQLVDELIGEILKDASLDFVTNVLPPTFPDGLDIEIIRIGALERLWARSRGDAFLFEWYNHDVRQHPELYKIKNITQSEDQSALRWTVDFPEDFEFVSRVFEGLSPNGESFTRFDVLELLKRDSSLIDLNRVHVRNQAYLDALQEVKTNE